MSTTVQAAITRVRSVHPAFSPFMVPDQALADFFTNEQQRLMSLALMRDRSYLAQSLSIVLDITNASVDAPGTAGAGTTGGVPAVAGSSLASVQATTGALPTVTGGTTYVTSAVVSAATSTTATTTGVLWVVNAYAGFLARIIAGAGANTAPRSIASNTTTAITVSAAWEVTPDTTSVFEIVAPVTAVDGTMAVVTDLPATTINRGYLVKLTSAGVPYLDYTAPKVSHVSRGIPLPSYYAILGGTVRFLTASGATVQSDYDAAPLLLVAEAARYSITGRPAAFIRGSQLFLCGSESDWIGVESIELSYVPVPPAFTSRTDLFLLPDTALPAIAASGAVFAASRIYGVAGVPQPPTDLLVTQAQAAEAAFLTTISLTKRARIGRVRPGGMSHGW